MNPITEYVDPITQYMGLITQYVDPIAQYEGSDHSVRGSQLMRRCGDI